MKETDLFSTIHHNYKWNRTLFVKARVRDVAVTERDERLNELDIKSCVELFFRSAKGGESVRLRCCPEASLVKVRRLWGPDCQVRVMTAGRGSSIPTELS